MGKDRGADMKRFVLFQIEHGVILRPVARHYQEAMEIVSYYGSRVVCVWKIKLK